MFKKTILPVLLATIWISLVEFLRNEVLAKSYWIEHYEELGLVFPSQTVNNVMWGVWSLLFASAIFILLKKFNLIQTTLLAWLVGFFMMWIVTWNLDVFPVKILVLAVPMSFIETFIAGLIIRQFRKK